MPPKKKQPQKDNQTSLDTHLIPQPSRKAINKQEQRMKNIGKLIKISQSIQKLSREEKQLAQELLHVEWLLKNVNVGRRQREKQGNPELLEPQYVVYSHNLNVDCEQITSTILANHPHAYFQLSQKYHSRPPSQLEKKMDKYTKKPISNTYINNTTDTIMEQMEEEQSSKFQLKTAVDQEQGNREEEQWVKFGKMDHKYLQLYLPHFINVLRQISGIRYQ